MSPIVIASVAGVGWATAKEHRSRNGGVFVRARGPVPNPNGPIPRAATDPDPPRAPNMLAGEGQLREAARMLGRGLVDWIQVAVQWLHVLSGMFWFGSVLYADFILIPVLSSLPLATQRTFTSAFAPRVTRIIPAVAMAAMGLGFLRGTVWGPIRNLDMLTSNYGITWIIGLVAALATFTWGKRVIEPALGRLNGISESDALLPDGRPSPVLAAAIDEVKRASMLELIGFVVIFSAMILMRFGA